MGPYRNPQGKAGHRYQLPNSEIANYHHPAGRESWLCYAALSQWHPTNSPSRRETRRQTWGGDRVGAVSLSSLCLNLGAIVPFDVSKTNIVTFLSKLLEAIDSLHYHGRRSKHHKHIWRQSRETCVLRQFACPSRYPVVALFGSSVWRLRAWLLGWCDELCVNWPSAR